MFTIISSESATYLLLDGQQNYSKNRQIQHNGFHQQHQQFQQQPQHLHQHQQPHSIQTGAYHKPYILSPFTYSNECLMNNGILNTNYNGSHNNKRGKQRQMLKNNNNINHNKKSYNINNKNNEMSHINDRNKSKISSRDKRDGSVSIEKCTSSNYAQSSKRSTLCANYVNANNLTKIVPEKNNNNININQNVNNVNKTCKSTEITIGSTIQASNVTKKSSETEDKIIDFLKTKNNIIPREEKGELNIAEEENGKRLSISTATTTSTASINLISGTIFVFIINL